jgi:hypothetical protein
VSVEPRQSGDATEAPEYDAIRAAARDLIPLFSPSGATGGHWGAALIDTVEPVEHGHRAAIVYPVASRWEKHGNAIERTVDVGMIRATGLALLVYAETYGDA